MQGVPASVAHPARRAQLPALRPAHPTIACWRPSATRAAQVRPGKPHIETGTRIRDPEVARLASWWLVAALRFKIRTAASSRRTVTTRGLARNGRSTLSVAGRKSLRLSPRQCCFEFAQPAGGDPSHPGPTILLEPSGTPRNGGDETCHNVGHAHRRHGGEAGRPRCRDSNAGWLHRQPPRRTALHTCRGQVVGPYRRQLRSGEADDVQRGGHRRGSGRGCRERRRQRLGPTAVGRRRVLRR